jgi:hypothetical protein
MKYSNKVKYDKKINLLKYLKVGSKGLACLSNIFSSFNTLGAQNCLKYHFFRLFCRKKRTPYALYQPLSCLAILPLLLLHIPQ